MTVGIVGISTAPLLLWNLFRIVLVVNSGLFGFGDRVLWLAYRMMMMDCGSVIDVVIPSFTFDWCGSIDTACGWHMNA
jgi:hypothetical protein